MTALSVDLSSLHAMLDEMGDAAEAAARPAAQAAIQVIYDEIKRNVAAIGHKTGNLDRSIYQVYSERNSGPGYATYQASWNHGKAPHGFWLEFGHIQRYASYVGRDGSWHTAVRPENRGKKAPWVGSGKKGRNRTATQAELDAWFMPRPGGPIQRPGYAYVRRAMGKEGEAVAAAKRVLIFHMNMNNYLPHY